MVSGWVREDQPRVRIDGLGPGFNIDDANPPLIRKRYIIAGHIRVGLVGYSLMQKTRFAVILQRFGRVLPMEVKIPALENYIYPNL